MRDPRAIQQDIDAASAKAARIKGELDTLTRATDLDAMDDKQLEAVDRRQRGYDAAQRDINQYRDELRDILRSKAGAGGYIEGGDGAAPAYADRSRRENRGLDVMRSNGLRMLEDLNLHDDVGRSLTPGQLDQLDTLIRRNDERFDGGYVAERLLITESEAYRSAFRKYVAASATGQTLVLSAEEANAVSQYQRLEVRRAMSENTTTAGGFGVPALVDPTILMTSGAADAPILRVCRVEQVTNNLWQGISSAPMTWSYSTEGTEATDNSPTLAQPQVRVHKCQGWLPYSIEVSSDYPNFIGEMSKLIDQGYNDLLATKTMTGSGTNEPFGIFVALSNATSVVTPTTDGSFGGPDIFKAWNALPERFRANATWVMSVNVQSAIRQFAASQSSTSAYFSIDLTGGTFRINDRPVIITDYAPTGVGGSVPGTTGLQNILAVADFNQTYLFAQRAGMSVEQVPLLLGASNRFPTGQRGMYAWARNGANVVVQRGGILLQNQ